MRRSWQLGWQVVVIVGWLVLAWWSAAQAQEIFTPTTNLTNQFSAYMKSPLAKAIGLIAMVTLAALAVETRGHGMAIFVAMLVLGAVLAFMFSAEKVIFPFLGFEG